MRRKGTAMARNEAYQIAEERIAAALKEGATELNLSKLGLTEVPSSVAKLTNLIVLNLSINQITAIPDAGVCQLVCVKGRIVTSGTCLQTQWRNDLRHFSNLESASSIFSRCC